MANSPSSAQTNSSSQPKPWVDGPYKLIPVPGSYLDIKSHFAIHMANEMALVHNSVLRGFNAIMLQGPHLASSPLPAYSPTLVHDFLTFTRCLLRGLEHHHLSEEQVGFAAIEREIGKPGHLNVAVEQHEAFHDGLEALTKYVKDRLVHPEEWTWEEMRAIIDGFMPALELHLTEEVETFLGLNVEDEAALRRAWKELEKHAVESGGLAALYDIFPVVFGCHDVGSPGGATFPPVPTAMRYVCEYWTGRQHRGAWRFCPCDMWSRPRPLLFLGGPDQPLK